MPRTEQVATEIGRALKLEQVRFVPQGARGQDSIYRIMNGEKIVGMLRLVNPYRKKTLPPDMPFRMLPAGERLTREREAYRKGGALGLTPAPLWHTEDALLCSYLPYAPMDARLRTHPEDAWTLLMKAAEALSRLHAAGITHMDASLANTLADDALTHIAFVDFEYGPAEGLSVAQQRAYDYLRLLESSWKFIPDNQRTHGNVWFAYVNSQLQGSLHAPHLEQLAPALERILHAGETEKNIREIFN